MAIRVPFNAGSPTTCDDCQIPFCLLTIHRKIFHEGAKENKCAFCGTPFASYDALLDHLDCHVENSESFCCLCLSRQKDDDSLAEHLESHEELHVVLCVACRRTFASKVSLSSHRCSLIELVAVKMEIDDVSVSPGEVPFILSEPAASVPSASVSQPEAPAVSDTNSNTPETESYHVNLRRRRKIVKLGERQLRMSFSEADPSIPEPSSHRLNGDDSSVSPCSTNNVLNEVATGNRINTEPTPPDSPIPCKKKRVSFNETVDYWNPLRRERACLAITEEFPEVREVPLLNTSTSKKSKTKKKSSKSTKKRSSKNGKRRSKIKQGSESDLESSLENSISNGDIHKDVIHTPELTEPRVLRPVLKPSSSLPIEETLKPKKEPINNFKALAEKFGADFHYRDCLKVDGRYHCPDEECRDNNDRGFIQLKGLQYHIKMRHLKADVHSCQVCNKYFPIESKLKSHMEVHNAVRSFKCPICEKMFKTAVRLNVHTNSHNKPWECYHCNERFSIKERLRIHCREMKCMCCNVVSRCYKEFLRHEAELPHVYQCTICPKTFDKLDRFNWHLRAIHYSKTTAIDGTWMCEQCGRKFTTRRTAVQHVRKSHSAPTNRQNVSSISKP